MNEATTKTEAKMALGSIVKNMMNNADEPNWDNEFIDQVMDAIPEGDERHYLREALGRLVYVFDNERRRITRKHVFGDAVTFESSEEVPTSPVTRNPSAVSTRRNALKELYWPEFMRSTISTDTGLVMIGMATAVQLDQAAVRLRDHAAATTKNAEALERLRDALEEAGVEKVSDLDESVVTKAYEGL